jgi:hypothetical protein
MAVGVKPGKDLAEQAVDLGGRRDVVVLQDVCVGVEVDQVELGLAGIPDDQGGEAGVCVEVQGDAGLGPLWRGVLDRGGYPGCPSSGCPGPAAAPTPAARRRCPAMPLRPRHGYAAELTVASRPAASNRPRSSPPAKTDRYAPQSSPHPPGSSWRSLLRGFYTAGSSRTPPRLACRTRAIR